MMPDFKKRFNKYALNKNLRDRNNHDYDSIAIDLLLFFLPPFFLQYTSANQVVIPCSALRHC